MKYLDQVYGENEISEPVILEIIASPEMQRLKGVDQAGYFEPYFPGVKHTRFEHSMGVYLLLKKYSAPLEEQIAGLIHDVSHPAFSHAGDYYFSSGSGAEQSHQDNSFEGYVRKSSLPGILAKYDFDLEYILDDKNFPLEENELPDLCADRIDYSLREMLVYGTASRDEVEYLLSHLKVEDKKWIFDDFESAQKYANHFKKLNENYFCGIKTALMFRTVGDYIKYSLEKKYISVADLYTTDEEVLEKISQHLKEDEKLQYLLDRMDNKIKYKDDPNDFEEKVVCKSRIVDPLCRYEGGIKRVSEINPDWQKVIQEEMKPKEYFLKFLK